MAQNAKYLADVEETERFSVKPASVGRRKNVYRQLITAHANDILVVDSGRIIEIVIGDRAQSVDASADDPPKI